MRSQLTIWLKHLLLPLLLAPASLAQQPSDPPLPDIRQLMHEVQAHQRQLDKVRENYTYTTLETTQDIDSNGQVTKTETVEQEDFFVNGHVIERTVKKNGKPLNDHDQQKETERVTKLVEKAEKTPPDQPLEGQTISISRVLEIMDVRNPRRENFAAAPPSSSTSSAAKTPRPTAWSRTPRKNLQGTFGSTRPTARWPILEVSFNDNFRVAGGLFASVQKGSNFRFDQAPVKTASGSPPAAKAPCRRAC